MVFFPSWRTNRPGKGVVFGVHLTLSLLAFSTLVMMMVLFWFPGELFLVDGGWQGLKLVAMVDLVLGPALTLILYKPDKPKLVFDMSMIAAIQIGALAYGFYTTHSQRTVAVVYAENKFATLSARDHSEANKQLAALDLEPTTVSATGLLDIPLVLTPQPADYGAFLQNMLNGYPELRERSDLYIPIADGTQSMQSGRQSEEQLEAAGALEIINKALAKRALTFEDTEIYPFKARYANGLVLFDPQQLRILDYVPYVEDKSPKQAVVTANQ